MDVELTPAQAPEVEAAISTALAPRGDGQPDPWWQAGVDEALEA